MSRSKILFIMTGSIACYKACQLLSKLSQNNYEVQVVATASALEFVGNATLEGLSGKAVVSDIFAHGRNMDHIHLARWADLIIVAPATANFINKMAQGAADDLASTLFLAHDFTKPFLVAPAMNTSMYQHPATQASLRTLSSYGVTILESASGVLACGEHGRGRLLEPDLLFSEIEKYLQKKPAKVPGPKILITAGGTQEAIDDVRVLTNTSTGQTGARLANRLFEAGYEVELLLSQGAQVQLENNFPIYKFSDFASLKSELKKHLQQKSYTHVIHAAAVGDYSISEIYQGDQLIQANGKLDSSKELTLKLKRNPKLINQIKSYSRNPNIKIIGFKLTSHSDFEDTLSKVEKLLLDADYVVHNDLQNIKKDLNQHPFALWGKGEPQHFENVDELSQGLVGIISAEIDK